MRTLELRRHALISPEREHLTQPEVELARGEGDLLGPFTRVVTSPSAACFETALAMGFAPTDRRALLGAIDAGVARELADATSFPDVARVVALGGASARLAHGLAFLWRDIVGTLELHAHALLIAHPHVIEIGVSALLAADELAHFGPTLGACEGVRLDFEGPRCRRAEVRRSIP